MPIPRATPSRRANFGAEGIGLCRTEHMFFEADRIAAIREMICADTVEEQRSCACQARCRCSRATLKSSMKRMEGSPVTIRFLDPPLHEFVPTEEEDIELLAKTLGKTVAADQGDHRRPARVQPDDGSPWLPSGCYLSGNRRDADHGCYPGCYQCQAKHPDWNIVPEIMIPLVGEVKELDLC